MTLMKRLLLASAVASSLLIAQAPRAMTSDEAIRQAISNNLDLAAARYSISVADARQITAKLRPNPVVSVSADHLDLLGTGYNTINNGGPNEYSLRTDFILERGGKRAAGAGRELAGQHRERVLGHQVRGQDGEARHGA